MAYPMEKKQTILKKYDELVKSGETVLNAAKACGVPYFTISRWQKAAGKVTRPAKRAGRPRSTRPSTRRPKASPAKRPAPAARGRSGIRLITPDGFEVEFPKVEDLIQVLNGLR